MKNWFLWFLLFPLILMASGCAHVISKDLRKASDTTLTLRQVLQNPSAFQGKNVVWGGEIIATLNQKDGTTQIEVLQRPLDRRGEPKEKSPSEGRFLVRADSYLDPYVYQQGKKVTVAGELIGEKLKPLGEMDYRYPLLLGKQIYLWPVYYSPYSYYYYDPWWFYPYGWWGFGFHYYYFPHHHSH
jgi:outer membrane lipoprotein